MPTVSVIIPTYNRASMVKEAIQSVLDQTYSDYEVIVVDDGSTDDTREVVSAFPSKVRFVFQENRGRSSARNHGILLSQGRYIAFLDSDDLFLPHKLEVQVSYMESEPEVGMTYTMALTIDEQGRELPMIYREILSGWIYRQILFISPVACPIATPTVMIRTDVLAKVGGFDESMDMAEDIDLWRRVARRYPILGIREPLSKFRKHPGNVTHDPEEILSAVANYLNKAFAEDPDLDPIFRRRGAAMIHSVYGQEVVRQYVKGIIQYQYSSSMARKFFIQAIKYWPLQFFAYPYLAATYLNESSWVAARNLWLGLKNSSLFRMKR